MTEAELLARHPGMKYLRYSDRTWRRKIPVRRDRRHEPPQSPRYEAHCLLCSPAGRYLASSLSRSEVDGIVAEHRHSHVWRAIRTGVLGPLPR